MQANLSFVCSVFQASKGQQELDSEIKQRHKQNKQANQTKYNNFKDLVQQGGTGVVVQEARCIHLYIYIYIFQVETS